MSQPTASAPLRIGFAGANAQRGWATDAHLGAIRALPGLAIQSVSARTQAIADEAAALYNAPSAYDDSLALARDPEVDIVAVTVKVPEHRAIVLAAIAAGKHVYCEWPLGRDFAETLEMADAARAAGVHVAIGLQGENSVAVRHAAKLVREGAIGQPLSLRVVSPTAGWGAESPAHYAYLQDKRNGATLSTIAGGHTLAAIEAVVGAYCDVSALGSILLDAMKVSGTDETVARTCADHLIVTGRHASGCVSSLEVVGGVFDVPFRFELRGTAGALTIIGGHVGGYQAGRLEVAAGPTAERQPVAVAPDLDGPPANVAQLWARFGSDIRNGTRTVPDFDRAGRLIRLLDTIDAASDQGRRLPVEYLDPMSTSLQLVLSNPNPGFEEEFNAWYAGPHLLHGVETPGVLSGQRFKRIDGPWPSGKHEYLMIWELDDPAFTLSELAKVKGTDEMPISPSINMDTVQPPTMWRRAQVRNVARIVTDSASRRTVVFGLYNAAEGAEAAFAQALLAGGLAELADLPGVISADYLTLADEQIRGNCRKYPHGLLIELHDEAQGLASLSDRLATLPHADAERWMAIVFRPLAEKLTKQAAERLKEHA